MSREPVTDLAGCGGESSVAPSVRKRRSVLRLRKWIQWTTLTRNIFASVKDGALIALVIGLLMFNDQVLDYLNEKASVFMPSRPPVNVVTLLQRLNKAVDTMPVQTQSASNILNVRPSKVRERAMRAEWHLLKSEDGEAINDWAVVLAARPDVKAASQEAKALDLATRSAQVYVKGGSARIVVLLGSSDDASDFLPIARRAYPMAALVSLSAWCPGTFETTPVGVCHL